MNRLRREKLLRREEEDFQLLYVRSDRSYRLEVEV